MSFPIRAKKKNDTSNGSTNSPITWKQGVAEALATSEHRDSDESMLIPITDNHGNYNKITTEKKMARERAWMNGNPLAQDHRNSRNSYDYIRPLVINDTGADMGDICEECEYLENKGRLGTGFSRNIPELKMTFQPKSAPEATPQPKSAPEATLQRRPRFRW